MTKNINDYERVFRFIFGTFIFSMAFWGPASNWYLIGLIPMATAFAGTCPFYWSMGVTTEVEDHRKKHWAKKNKGRQGHEKAIGFSKMTIKR